jgi:hypothetical protein
MFKLIMPAPYGAGQPSIAGAGTWCWRERGSRQAGCLHALKGPLA